MKLRFSVIFLFFVSILAAGPSRKDAVRMLETAPLRFEPADDMGSGQFIARGPKCNLSFAGSQATLQAGDKTVRLKFVGASNSALRPEEKLQSTTSLYLGNDRSKWRTAIPNYSRLEMADLYPGIDLVYYGNSGQLEYDLNIKPGADPAQIRLRIDGARARIDGEGNLVSDLIQKRPDAFQLGANGQKVPVVSRFHRNRDGSFGFAVGKYDRSRELVIDPGLTFSQYLSGNYQDLLQSIGFDKHGYLYVAGTVYSTNLSVVHHIQGANDGIRNIFVAKMNPNAVGNNRVIFSTYLGGENNDTVSDMAVGPNGDIYLTGTTTSSTFPLENAAQSALGGTQDAFVVWINTSYGLAFSTFLGGSDNDVGMGIAVDSENKIYVTGGTDSTDFPGSSAFQAKNAGRQDAFIVRYNPSKSGSGTLIYASYLGGGGWDQGNSIAVLEPGIVWIAGQTFSGNFPSRGHSYQPTYQDAGDAFVARINTGAGSAALEYTSFLGGDNEDAATSVVIDASGRVIVTGWTLSANFPVSAHALQPKYGGNSDVFLTMLEPSASSRGAELVYSSYFGGSGPDVPADLKQDSEGNLYICGYTISAGLPTTSNAIQREWDGSMDVFALKFTPPTVGAAAIDYLTYLGSDGIQAGNGIAVDAKGNIYFAGYTSGSIFAPFKGAGKISSAGQVDGFVAGVSTK